MASNDIKRRDFLRRLTAFGALGIGGSTLLSACGGGEAPAGGSAAEAPSASGSGCTDVSGLTEQEVGMRNQLQYVDVTATPEKRCDNCALYVAASAGAACGTCSLVKGPIAPAGFCISWAPKAT